MILQKGEINLLLPMEVREVLEILDLKVQQIEHQKNLLKEI